MLSCPLKGVLDCKYKLLSPEVFYVVIKCFVVEDAGLELRGVVGGGNNNRQRRIYSSDYGNHFIPGHIFYSHIQDKNRDMLLLDIAYGFRSPLNCIYLKALFLKNLKKFFSCFFSGSIMTILFSLSIRNMFLTRGIPTVNCPVKISLAWKKRNKNKLLGMKNVSRPGKRGAEKKGRGSVKCTHPGTQNQG